MLVSLLLTLVLGCSETEVKLEQDRVTPATRLVFGKYVDLNPDSIPEDLKFTYILSDKRDGMFLVDSRFPNLDPELGYFWVLVPMEMHFFGVGSLRLSIRGQEDKAVFRDEEDGQPILGVDLPEGKAPVYVGEITIRSFLKKIEEKSDGREVFAFALKELSVKKNLKKAKDEVTARGIDPKTLVDKPLVVMNAHEVTSSKSK